MKGPALTVLCDCGQVRAVGYREVWECESCGRRWNTSQVPEAEYRRIADEVRRFKVQALGGFAVIAVVFGVLALVVAERFLLMMPVALGLWGMWLRPRRRRRLREYARSLPTWDLRPE